MFFGRLFGFLFVLIISGGIVLISMVFEMWFLL